MGTRACFWIGNPAEVPAEGEEDTRIWLGAVGCDGYQYDKRPFFWTGVNAEEKFRAKVREIEEERAGSSPWGAFASPERGAFPYPWPDDLFLTDYTYAFFDGAVWVACFHGPFMPAGERPRRYELCRKRRDEGEDGLCRYGWNLMDEDRCPSECPLVVQHNHGPHWNVPVPESIRVYDQSQPDSIMMFVRKG